MVTVSIKLSTSSFSLNSHRRRIDKVSAADRLAVIYSWTHLTHLDLCPMIRSHDLIDLPLRPSFAHLVNLYFKVEVYEAEHVEAALQLVKSSETTLKTIRVKVDPGLDLLEFDRTSSLEYYKFDLNLHSFRWDEEGSIHHSIEDLLFTRSNLLSFVTMITTSLDSERDLSYFCGLREMTVISKYRQSVWTDTLDNLSEDLRDNDLLKLKRIDLWLFGLWPSSYSREAIHSHPIKTFCDKRGIKLDVVEGPNHSDDEDDWSDEEM
jgi:hypothetical protein